MGLFSGIGKLLSGAVKGIGSFLGGGLFGPIAELGMGLLGRKDQKDANQQAREDDLTRFVRLREGAEMAGFNPLTALQYGGTAGIAHSAPPLASMQMISSGLNRVSDEISGRSAQQRERERLETDLAKIKLDDYKAQQIARATAYTRAVEGKQTATKFAAGTLPTMGKAANAEREMANYPRGPVRLFNSTANKWVYVNPLIADRLELKDGMAILAEDYEAILGDVGSEIINTPNALNEALGFGSSFPSKPSPQYTPNQRATVRPLDPINTNPSRFSFPPRTFD